MAMSQLAESLFVDVAAATISVPLARLDEVARVYVDTFGWEVHWAGTVDGTAWGIGARPRRAVVLGPRGDERGVLRLIEGETPAPPPLATYGWSAIEITVRDVDGLAGRLRVSGASVGATGDFRINGEPTDLLFSGGPPGQRAMQAVGPAGEQLYLTQILRQTPGRELAAPPAGQETGAVFITVLAARDYAAARAFYVECLGMDAYIEVDAALSVAAREAGWPAGLTCKLAAVRGRGETRIELDGYPRPPLAKERQASASELPPGFGLASFVVVDLDRGLAAASSRSFGAAAPGSKPFAAPARHSEPPYNGRWAATLRGGDGELIELIGLED
jgi:hypothetical protein